MGKKAGTFIYLVQSYIGTYPDATVKAFENAPDIVVADACGAAAAPVLAEFPALCIIDVQGFICAYPEFPGSVLVKCVDRIAAGTFLTVFFMKDSGMLPGTGVKDENTGTGPGPYVSYHILQDALDIIGLVLGGAGIVFIEIKRSKGVIDRIKPMQSIPGTYPEIAMLVFKDRIYPVGKIFVCIRGKKIIKAEGPCFRI